MALKTWVYNNAKLKMLQGTFTADMIVGTIDADTLVHFMLMKNTYPALADPASVYVADIVTYETDADGYVGGHAGADRMPLLGAKAWSAATNDIKYTSGTTTVTWSAIGDVGGNHSVGAAVMYIEKASDATSTLLACFEFTAAVTLNSGNFVLTIAAGGLLNGTHVAT